MTITADRKWADISSQQTFINAGGKAKIEYFVKTDDPANEGEPEIRAFLIQNEPSRYFNLIRQSVDVAGRVTDSPTEAIWDASISYTNAKNRKQEFPGSQGDPDENPSRTIVEIRTGSGETVNRVFSNELVEEVANQSAYILATNDLVKNAVGLTSPSGDSGALYDFDGIPVTVGTVEIVAYAYKSLGTVNGGYLIKCSELAARNVVNKNKWKNFAAGTLRFAGFEAVQQAGDPQEAGWQFTYLFLFSANLTPEDLNKQVEGLPDFTKGKKGHEYFEVLKVPRETNVGGATVVTYPVAVRAAVHKIYDEVDFLQELGI